MMFVKFLIMKQSKLFKTISLYSLPLSDKAGLIRLSPNFQQSLVNKGFNEIAYLIGLKDVPW